MTVSFHRAVHPSHPSNSSSSSSAASQRCFWPYYKYFDLFARLSPPLVDKGTLQVSNQRNRMSDKGLGRTGQWVVQYRRGVGPQGGKGTWMSDGRSALWRGGGEKDRRVEAPRRAHQCPDDPSHRLAAEGCVRQQLAPSYWLQQLSNICSLDLTDESEAGQNEMRENFGIIYRRGNYAAAPHLLPLAALCDSPAGMHGGGRERQGQYESWSRRWLDPSPLSWFEHTVLKVFPSIMLPACAFPLLFIRVVSQWNQHNTLTWMRSW